MKWRVVLVALTLAVAIAAPAAAKTYSAERFDSSIRVLPGGDLEVTETVVFRFDGTFQYVFREIPKRRTDAIEVVRASMDERTMPFGNGTGQVELSDKSRMGVRWRFTPVTNSTHTFTLVYRVRGVAYPVDQADFLQWRALPDQHTYTIDSSTIVLEHPGNLVREPVLDRHRVDDARLEQSGQTVRIVATGIERNGWLRASLHFARGSLIAEPPGWLRAEQRAEALAPRWITAAALVTVVGLIALWMLRQRYDAPPREPSTTTDVVHPPDTLAPAIAGSVASNGGVSIEHAMAALFALAERGEIAIKEEPKGVFGQRNFQLIRNRTTRPGSVHEQTAIDIVFKDKNRDESTVTLNKARTRLTRHFSRFKKALQGEMITAGLIEDERKRIRARYGAVSLTIILLACVAGAGVAFLVREYRAWPLLIPGAMVLVSIIGFIFQASTTPLSNDGVRRRERWRAYQKHLKEVAAQKAHITSSSPAGLLPLAVTLGLASAWAKFVKTHPGMVPPWFEAIAVSDDAAFPAFIAAGGASAAGGAGGAAGGAGGGASGAG